MLEAKQILLGRLAEAPWNANRVPPTVQAKIRRSIERFGVVENLVARPHPSQEGSFEVLSGNPDGKQLAVVDPAGTLSIHAKSGTSTVVARGVSAIDW